MTTTTTLVRSELGRLTATPLARLAFIALMVVPLLYGGAYLWANKNPYAKLDHIPAAIVNQDTGATKDGTPVNYGKSVTNQTVSGGDFKWSRVSASKAADGVRDGTYDFVVTIPTNFSQSLVSSSGKSPTQARIAMTTADTNSYLASTIAKEAGKTIRTAVQERVGKQAATTLLVGLSDIRSQLGKAVTGASQLASGAAKASDGATTLSSGTGSLRSGAATLAASTATLPAQTTKLNNGAQQVASGSSQLASGLASAANQTSALPAQTAKLNTGAQSVATGSQTLADTVRNQPSSATPATIIAQLDAAGAQLTDTQKTIIGAALTSQAKTQAQTIASLEQSLDKLSAGATAVASGTQQLASQSGTLASSLSQASTKTSQLAAGASQVASGTATLASKSPELASGTAQLSSGAAKVDDGTQSLASGVTSLSTGATKLTDSLTDGQKQIPASTASTRSKQASVISNPVKVSNDDIASAGTYGAGLAPFFISLAAWIGMYALFLILKPISKRAITAVKKPVRVALGALATPVVLGVVQMSALYLIVRYALGFGAEHPAGMLGLMMLASAAFAAIIMALNVMLGSVGQFLGLVLMLVQLVTAGGTFPWQTLPSPLAALHFALPMSYAVDGLRQLMYGGSISAAWSDAAVLACWLVGALIVTALIAARQTRKRTLKDLRPSLIG